jgi:DNA polymerase V
VPLVSSKVCAGFPSPADDHIEGVFDLNELLIKNPPATFMVRVAGESMREAHIYPGDLLVVDRSKEARDGSIIVACLDGEFTVKRLRKKGRKV